MTSILNPSRLREAYECDVETQLAVPQPLPALITEGDLMPLPFPVQRYLRRAGVVGQTRVRSFSVRMHGRIRSGPNSSWMRFRAEQHNVMATRARLFYLEASTFGLPLQGYHRYADGHASMDIRAFGRWTVQSASGPELTRAETVTLFNDMCVMAPATLIDPAIKWQSACDHMAVATFAHAGHEIHAELTFDDDGDLVNFTSGDRSRMSPNGTSETMSWSTPLGRFRDFDGVRLPSHGEGRWHAPEGEYAYVEIEIDEVNYNVEAPVSAGQMLVRVA